LKYWTRQPYLGFGVDAHSMLLASDDPYVLVGAAEGQPGKNFGGSSACELPAAAMEAVRFATPDSLDQYLAGAPLKRTPVSRRAAVEEAFFLGLRLVSGVNFRQVEADHGSEVVTGFLPQIRELIECGLLQQEGDVIRLTARGRLLSNEVFERFVSAAEGVQKA
jgi:oxygen-independent coproporphyrinogen-3 oxidase